MAQADVTKHTTYGVLRTSGGDEVDVAKHATYVVVNTSSTVTTSVTSSRQPRARWLPIITQEA